MINTVVFDFDGTVANTLPLCFEAFQHVFQTFDQRKLSALEISAMFGPSAAGMIERHLGNRAAVADAVSLFYGKYAEKHHEYVRPFTALHEFIAELKRSGGYRLALFTGKGRPDLAISMRQLELDGTFDMVVSGDDVTEPKPNPEGLHAIMTGLRCDAKNMVMIGDSDADVEAAHRAGVRAANC